MRDYITFCIHSLWLVGDYLVEIHTEIINYISTQEAHVIMAGGHEHVKSPGGIGRATFQLVHRQQQSRETQWVRNHLLDCWMYLKFSLARSRHAFKCKRTYHLGRKSWVFICKVLVSLLPCTEKWHNGHRMTMSSPGPPGSSLMEVQ